MRLGGLKHSPRDVVPPAAFFYALMHLLYLDDSGSAANAAEDYFVLGGISVYEAQANWFTQELDKLATTISPSDPHSVEFHASEVFSRKAAPWRGVNTHPKRATCNRVELGHDDG